MPEIHKDALISQILKRGVKEVVQKDRLEAALRSGRTLRVKLGIDPTSPYIHIGRAVLLWKLKAFQDLGHQVVLIFGDFTGVIGDTSDKDSERPMLTPEAIQENMKTYLSQAYLILDEEKTEIHYNSEWLSKLDFWEISRMANSFSMHEFSARENIKKRLDAGKRVSLRELMYPLMQGYDSVAVKADVEIGGSDQYFNLLAGRTLQPVYGQPAQDILTMELLPGLDGRKMSSSWGNTINLTDPAREMFSKAMSLSDDLMPMYFNLATQTLWKHQDEITGSYDHPRDQKLILAHAITELYHGSEGARDAHEYWVNTVSKKQIPGDVQEMKVAPGMHSPVELLVSLGLLESEGEARRLIEQSGMKIDGEVVALEPITIKPGDTKVLQVGKKKILKLRA